MSFFKLAPSSLNLHSYAKIEKKWHAGVFLRGKSDGFRQKENLYISEVFSDILLHFFEVKL